MNERRIDLNWITVKDLKKAIAFYTEVVGLTVTKQSDNWGFPWAELSASDGGASLGLVEEHEGPTTAGSNAVASITVDNLDEAKEKISATFIGEVKEVPGQARAQLCADPDGNLFHLFERLTDWCHAS